MNPIHNVGISGTTSNKLNAVPGAGSINASGITDVTIRCQSVGTTAPMNWEYDYTLVSSFFSYFLLDPTDGGHSAYTSGSPGKQ